MIANDHNQINSNHSIAAIIPAYNESKGIVKVLEVLRDINYLSEIIVVDDGSKDGTGKNVIKQAEKDPRIHLIRHEKNQGKGQSVSDAIKITNSNLIITLDADLKGLKPLHISQLVEPLLTSDVDMTLGIFKGGNLRTDLSHWLTPWLSGQRALWLSHLEKIYWPAASGYGLETAITAASQKYQWKTRRVFWMGVSHPPSEVHRGLIRGVYNRSKMYSQILKAWILATWGDRKTDKIKIFNY